MSERLPALAHEDYRPDQQAFLNYFRQSVEKNAPHPGAADRATKTLFPVLGVMPQVGKLNVDMMAAIEADAPTLPAEARETASLVTTTFFKSVFVGKIHQMNASKLGLLTEEQAETICSGNKPQGLNEKCDVAYDIAHHLLYVRGALPQDLYDHSVKIMGKDGPVGIMHIVSLMAWTSMGLNIADVPAPKPPPPSESE